MNHPPDLRHARAAVVWLRIVSSLAWLDSALIGKDAKLSSTFLSGAGLVHTIDQKFLHTALSSGIAAVLQHVIVPHAHLFAVLIGATDLAIGISLLFGIFSRLGALGEIGRSCANILIAGGAGADTVGFNSMLIAAGIIVIATRAGRRYGVDRYLIERWPSSRLLRWLS